MVWYAPTTWFDKKKKPKAIPKTKLSLPKKPKVSTKSKDITYTWGLLDNPLNWNQDQIFDLQQKLYSWGYLTTINAKKVITGTYDKVTRDAYYGYLNKRVSLIGKGYSREESKRVSELPSYQPTTGAGGAGGYSLAEAIAREKQQRAHPYLQAPFKADVSLTFQKMLNRAPTSAEMNFILNKYVKEGWDIGSVTNYLLGVPEYKELERKTKLRDIGDELSKMWVSLTGYTPAEANVQWAVFSQYEQKQWGYEEFRKFLRATPAFKMRYPDMPENMSPNEYDDFMRQANAISLNYGKGSITETTLKQLIKGEAPELTSPTATGLTPQGVMK